MESIHIGIQGSGVQEENRLRYVLDFIQNHPSARARLRFHWNGKTTKALSIYYGERSPQENSAFFIPRQAVFFNSTPVDTSEWFANAYTFEETILYAVEDQNKGTQAFLQGRRFGFDLLETLFFHLSRYEEWHAPEAQWNQWDMMREEAQFLIRHQLQRQPVVDRLVYYFLKALGIPLKPLPRKYTLSHDIDEVQKFSSPWRLLRSSGALLLKGRKLSSQVRLWRAYFASTDPFDTFDWMLSKEEGIEKSIYFLVGGTHRYDSPYELNNERMKTIFALCKARGYRIGLHPSYATWRDADLFRKEKEKLEEITGQVVETTRQHYLHFDFKKTPRVLEDLGVREDSSLGFNNHLGFRCGTGFPYHLYDFTEERAFSFLEKPLVVMDSALLQEGQYDPEQIEQLWLHFLQENRQFTQITFNFHNSRFFDAWVHHIPLKALYENLLRSQV